MGQFWLEFDNQGSRQRFDFNQMSVSIGRDPSSDFHLDHPTVSRQHALIVQGQGTHQLVVLSQNGLTAINGQKVGGTVDLRAGQLIQLGELQFVFHSAAGFSDNEPATEQVDLNSLKMSNESTAPIPVDGSVAHAATAALPPVSGAQQSSVGFGGPNQSGFGSQPPAHQSGFGSQPPAQQSGFGSQPPAQQSGFGAQQSGFGAQPPAQQSGFGAQPPAQQSGFGQQVPQQGFGAPNGQQQAPPANGAGKQKKEGSEEFKIPSWDTIAAQAVDDEGPQSGPTDFQRLQKAQKKAIAGSKGTNPVVLAVGIAGIAGMGYFLFFHKKPPKPITAKEEVTCERSICPKKPINCAGKEACIAGAIGAYKVADKLYKEKTANITNLFEAYRQLDKADVYLGIAGLSAPPEDMKDYQERLVQYETELDEQAKNFRQQVHKYKQRKNYEAMAKAILDWKGQFPGRDNRWWNEAIEAEREMKDRGTWPRKYMKRK